MIWGSTGSEAEGAGAIAGAADLAANGELETFHGLGSSPDAPRLFVFVAAGQLYACELTAVREIVPYGRATRLPGAPPFVAGLINLRGSIITVLDLGTRLGGRLERNDQLGGSIVLVEAGVEFEGQRERKVVGLRVDELRDVQRIARASIEPSGMEQMPGGVVQGVLHVDGEVAVLLDVGRIVADALV